MKNTVCSTLLLAAMSLTAFSQTQLIVNGGFETPTAGEWVISGTGASQKSNPLIAYDGSSYLGLGNSTSAQFAYQSIFIPTNTVAAVLSYFYDVFSVAPASDGSSLIVQVWTNNQLAATVDVKSSSDSVGQSQGSANYRQAAFDLTAFKGQTNQIVFQTAVGTFGNGTFFDIDDVSVLIETTADIPPNDYFTNRTVLTGTNLTVVATNTFATKETGEPNHAGNAGGRSLWWSWTAPMDGVLQLNSGNSTFSPLLAVYTGNSITNLTRIVSNDGSQAQDLVARVKTGVRAGTQYQIAVDGVRNGSDVSFGTVRLNLSFQLDVSAPKVTISSPASGAKVTNSTVTVQGTASDNVAVAAVLYRLENATGVTAFQPATGTNRWSAGVTGLVPGTNTIRAFAVDTSSNISAIVSRTFHFVIVSPLSLSVAGSGTVAPNYNQKLLEVGKTYVITAKPAKGQVFSNWTGDISSSNPKLSFVMQSNMVLQANFIPNPFLPAKGSYAGLFYGTNGITSTNAGFFSAMVTDRGTFSARVVLPVISASVSGKLALDGSFSNAIARPGKTPISFQGHLDLNGGDVLTGTFSADLQTSDLTANREVWSKTNPAPEGGKKYTLVFPGSADSAAAPGGFGFGTVTVDVSGNIRFSGVLGDGSKVSQKTFLSKDGLWPFFASPYSGKGSIIGWLAFVTNNPSITINGDLSWVKEPRPGTKLYPLGFDFENSVQAAGSVYTFSTGAPLLSSSSGEVVLQGGNLSQSITNPFAIGANYKVTGANNLSLTFTPASGLFKGSVMDLSTGKKVPVSGALLQGQDAGYGLFVGTNQTGSVLVIPQ